jgi:LPXTG-motif cell wall-anchored protein
MISASPGAKVEQYLKDLIDHSEEPLTSALKSIDLKKEGINTPEELLSYLFNNKGKYSETSLNRSIADLISSKNIAGEGLKTKNPGFWKNNLWILWIAIGAGLLSLFLIFWKRKNKKNDNK